MGDANKGREIMKRMAVFGGEVVRLCGRLPDTREWRHVADQLLRAGTAIGAHYSEAAGAQSTADFAHKVSIALKEARETQHWLRVVAASTEPGDATPEALLAEVEQFVAILQASQTTVRRRTGS